MERSLQWRFLMKMYRTGSSHLFGWGWGECLVCLQKEALETTQEKINSADSRGGKWSGVGPGSPEGAQRPKHSTQGTRERVPSIYQSHEKSCWTEQKNGRTCGIEDEVLNSSDW